MDIQDFTPECTSAGVSDWLDGFVARRYNQGSVIGSYLDPLADKVLICSTAAALAIEVPLIPRLPSPLPPSTSRSPIHTFGL